MSFPMPLPGNLDLSSELRRGTQQVVVRSSACLRLLALLLSIEPGLLASELSLLAFELSLLASSAGPIGQRHSTESPRRCPHCDPSLDQPSPHPLPLAHPADNTTPPLTIIRRSF
jgi:hypothetical protein